ncbi:MAG: GPI anchored serine-threonine rich family protein, partial [Candidatus Thorarchaeota archaeon]
VTVQEKCGDGPAPSYPFCDDFESGLSKWISITGLWHLTDDTKARPNSYHSPVHSMWFGNESTGDYDTGMTEYGDLISIPFNLSDTEAAFVEFYHWRETEGSNYDISYLYISIDGNNWDLIYETDDAYIPPWEKVSVDISSYIGNTSVQMRFTFDTIDDIMNDYRGWLVDDVAVMGTGVEIPHNLRVSLEVPENPELFTTYTVNVTVTNIGTNAESDVYLYLYLGGVSVYSAYYQNFPIHSSQDFSYMWTPTYYEEYNFTAHAPPVTGEEFAYDNVAIEIIPLHELILFGGMFLNYSFFLSDTNYTWHSLYSEVSQRFFHNDYSLYLDEVLVQMGYWNVDSQTRIISNSYGGVSFDSGAHTPLWVFTDVSIGEIISIAVDREGDHDFYVARELIYDLPGFGLVEVWELEDLTLPGGIAWYEKSTGILLNGTFPYYDGLYNYSFNLLDTNALSKSITVIIPHNTSSWQTGISQSISWISIGYISDVKIELYLDGVSVMEIVASTPNVGSYDWTIPITIADSTLYQIKISDVADPAIDDFSDNFEIFNPTITITTPDSTSSWETGTSQSITWTLIGSISDVKIELYLDGVSVMEIVAITPNDGSYDWTIPITIADSTLYQIKISDVANPTTEDFSDYFEIFTPITDSLTVTNPESLTEWEMGTTQQITWISTGTITDVKIELFKGGVPLFVIVASTSNDGSYDWTIPTYLTDDDDYQIRVTDVLNPVTYDDSPIFTITPADTGGGPPGIPGYNLFIFLGIICVISTISMRNLFKRKLTNP